MYSIHCIGTSIAFRGLNQTESAWTSTVSIDDQEPQTVVSSSAPPNPQRDMSYDWLVFSDLSPDTQHTIRIVDVEPVDQPKKIDYAYVTPRMDTWLMGEKLLIDDSYEGVRYFGEGWEESENKWGYDSGSTIVVPHGGGTHVTRRVGDGVEFEFYGACFYPVLQPGSRLTEDAYRRIEYNPLRLPPPQRNRQHHTHRHHRQYPHHTILNNTHQRRPLHRLRPPIPIRFL